MDVFDEMVKNWPSPRVRQKDVRRFSFGAISGKRLANLRALGEDLPPCIRVARHNLYDTVDLANWLRRRYGKKAA